MTTQNDNVIDLFNPTLDQALSDWEKIVGKERLILGEDLVRYDNCPSQTKRRIRAALQPISAKEVQAVLLVANLHNIPVHPISTGNNWGFGGANPVIDNAVIIDLSRMNKILDFNEELGVITVEPGVTQGQIAEYLKKNEYPFMLSTIVSGPNCSYLANALERGIGMIPPRDRFLSLSALKAVLADGSVYQSLISDAGGDITDKVYKWGVGPYLDGLFSQGSFGIVTEASFILSRKPEQITRFYFSPKHGIPLEKLIAALREAKQVLGNAVNSFEFGNRTEAVYGPHEENSSSNLFNFRKWMVYGSLHASRRVSKALIKELKQILSDAYCDFVFLTKDTLKRIDSFPFIYRSTPNWRYVVRNIDHMKSYMDLYEGIPNKSHLEYAYSAHGVEKNNLDYEADMKKTGFIFYKPVLPLLGRDLEIFLNILSELSQEYNMSPGLNLGVASETHIIAGVAIFFDPVTESEQAKDFHKALFMACKAKGYLPYRAHIDTMEWFVDEEKSSYFNVVSQIKSSLDPKNILSVGKFSK